MKRDDTELLVAAAAGDERAFSEFYRRWLPVLTGYHLRRVSSRELAFDLTAETFAAVVADLGRFDPCRGPAAAWLFGIAEHKLADSRRRARVGPGTHSGVISWRPCGCSRRCPSTA